MDSKPLKILLMGDASSYHATLAAGLRALGHSVAVVSNGSRWMNTDRDINLSRRASGRWAGLEYWLKARYSLLPSLSGYDVVSIHNPIFLEQRPNRNRIFFDMLKRRNRAIFLTALGTDTAFVEECLDPASQLAYNEYRIGESRRAFAVEGEPWLRAPLASHCRYIYDAVDGVTPVILEYHLAVRRWLPAEKVQYTGIPIDTDAVKVAEIPEHPEKVRLFLGRHSYRQAEKGTDILEMAARKAVERSGGRAELVLVEDRPYAEFLQLLSSAHIALDQLYSYSPGTNALLAMAMGKVAVTGAEETFYNFLGERHNRPAVNAPLDFDRLTNTLVDLVTHPDTLRQQGLASREFITKHYSKEVVASRAVEFWLRRLKELNR